jgi:hypothetical protein
MTQIDKKSAEQTTADKSLVFVAGVGLAIILCVLSCSLLLFIPTQSISVDTVYEGF